MAVAWEARGMHEQVQVPLDRYHRHKITDPFRALDPSRLRKADLHPGLRGLKANLILTGLRPSAMTRSMFGKA